MVPAEGSQIGGKTGESFPIFTPLPAHPAYFVILTIGVVVSFLGTPIFVAGRQHGHALGEEQGGEKISLLAAAQCIDCWIIGRSFHATIPAIVIFVAIAIFLAVRLVMRVLIADEVGERKTIVGSDEINARAGSAAGGFIEIGAAAEAMGHLAGGAAITF